MALGLCNIGNCLGQSNVLPQFHMETVSARHIKAILTDAWETPKFTPRWWAFYAPIPPAYSGQSHVKADLSLDDMTDQRGQTQELSPLQRQMLWLRADAPAQAVPNVVTTRVTYEVTLYSRHILPGPPSAPILDIPAASRAFDLRSSETIDYTAQPFQHWLDAQNLRCSSSEGDLAFAFRVYQAIRKLYHYYYEPTQNRKASNICLVNQSDCGGLSYLFVATLRANHIPAHSLAGRLAKSASKPEDYGQCHVKSEFFANGIGWVPVDMSFGVSSTDQDCLRYFGNDPGDLLVMHQDTDIVLAPQGLSSNTYYTMQKSIHYASGAGSFDGNKDSETWMVEDLPL